MKIARETPAKRPRRKAKALAPLGIDPALVDPLRILAKIAANPKTPAHARVSACRALLAAGAGGQAPPDPADVPEDALTRRALEIMAEGRRRLN